MGYSVADWQGRSVLVTGAGGFIGSHLAERLAELGAKVRALVHYRSTGSWGWLEQSTRKESLEVVAGDVRDRDSVLQAMRGVEVVFHLAATIAIPHSYDVPASFVDTNIGGTLNVLQAAKQSGVQRIVHTSTSEVYGTAQYVPIDERHPLQAQSPYSATKIGADKLVEAFDLSYDLPAVTVRPFNTYGPRQSSRAIVPTIITQALTASRVRLGSLTPTRDMNYVRDTVEGFVLAGLVPGAIGRIFNIGSGREIQIGELAQLIGQLLGCSLEIEQEPQRLRPRGSEVERLLADTTAAREVLGWQPTITLEEGLAATIEWVREHLHAYRPGVYAI